MRFGIVAIPTVREADGLFERAIGFAARVEALGFAGLWTTDSFARGSATLDPLLFLSALCQTTERIELGTCVTQVPLRHPVEQAHRAQTINLLSRGRFRFDPKSHNVIQPFIYVREVKEVGGGLNNVPIDKVANVTDPGTGCTLPA